jgi:hypothetical protein
MWTVDMSRCPACPDKESCADRKEILTTLSGTSHKLNTDPAYVDGPGDGIIIVACHHNR